jgi:hypothetical protein
MSRCVIKAFIGKTADGAMAYYDMENPYHKTDTQHLFWVHGVGSGGAGDPWNAADPWTGTVPHHVNFGYRIELDDFAIQTGDGQFHRYFTGENKDIVRLELDPALFARQLVRQHKYSEEQEINQMW